MHSLSPNIKFREFDHHAQYLIEVKSDFFKGLFYSILWLNWEFRSLRRVLILRLIVKAHKVLNNLDKLVKAELIFRDHVEKLKNKSFSLCVVWAVFFTFQIVEAHLNTLVETVAALSEEVGGKSLRMRRLSWEAREEEENPDAYFIEYVMLLFNKGLVGECEGIEYLYEV